MVQLVQWGAIVWALAVRLILVGSHGSLLWLTSWTQVLGKASSTGNYRVAKNLSTTQGLCRVRQPVYGIS